MKKNEIEKILKAEMSKNPRFIRWFRKENDFLDYDLIDRFMAQLSSNEEFEGVELMTMDEMWQEVQRICGTRVKLVLEKSGDRVEWEHLGKTGMHNEVCVYCPETLMTIFDVETRGNTVDS
jgi:xanthine/CO dehydrogenase XdhC/CoxF family maturation factor